MTVQVKKLALLREAVTFKAELGFKARPGSKLIQASSNAILCQGSQAYPTSSGAPMVPSAFIRPAHLGPARVPCVQEHTGPVSSKDKPWDQLTSCSLLLGRGKAKGTLARGTSVVVYLDAWCRKGDTEVVIYGEICGTPTRSYNS